jgi:hypothetical protein
MSRRMQGIFAGLDNIGEDIAGTQLGNSRGTPVLQARHAVPAVRGAQGQRLNLIVIDSDSEEDYETQRQNFQDSTREIADIRNRARQLSTIRRKRGVGAANATTEGANEGSNSDNAPRRPGGTLRSTATGMDTLNRLMGRGGDRPLNPFRPTQNQEPPHARHEGIQDAADPSNVPLERAREARRVIAPLRARRQPVPSDISTPTPSPSPPRELLSSSPPRRSTFQDGNLGMLSSFPAVPSHNFQELATQSAREDVRARHPNNRAADLDRREQAVTAREVTLRNQEVLLNERGERIRRLAELCRRQRGEMEILLSRQKEELDRAMGG